MARWDDLRRAILSRDQDTTEHIWLELLESGSQQEGVEGPGDLGRFLEASTLLARQQGGKRQAGSLLLALTTALTEAKRPRELLVPLARLAEVAPDDGTVRQQVIDAAQAGWSDREDLEALIDGSGVRTAPGDDLPARIEQLERLLKIEQDAWVFHRSGWGVGKIVEMHPAQGRCVVDFQDRPGHEMEIEAAARLLERLEPSDIRVRAVEDQRGLRAWTKENPLDAMQQVLSWYNNSCKLNNIKASLVPDAVAPSTWATWWKKAKSQALLDPRFAVGAGRDPRVEIHEVAGADFRSQVENSLKRSKTVIDRQKVVREMIDTVKDDDSAREVLVEVAQRELDRADRRGTARLGWEIVMATLRGEDVAERLSNIFAIEEDALDLVSKINDDKVREQCARAFARSKGVEGLERILGVALAQDDPVVAEVANAEAPELGCEERVQELIQLVDSKPAQHPNLYAWYLKRLVRGKMPEVEFDAYPLVRRVLKVIDGVEYRVRRGGSLKEKKAVGVLGDVLAEKSCAIVKQAAEETDEQGAHHLAALVTANRGLRNVQLQRMQDAITSKWPNALRQGGGTEDDVDVEDASEIYMTAKGLESLRAEAKRLESEDMPKTSDEIARAREFGDLRENAEYHAAREKLSMLQAQLDKVKGEVTRAVVLTPEIVQAGAVSVGTRVKLRDSDGSEVSYTLFGPPDVDVDRGIINYMTPLAQALMSRKVGEQVRIDIEGSVRELEVLEIENAIEKGAGV